MLQVRRARSAPATIAIRTAPAPPTNADAAICRPSIFSARAIASISRALSSILSIDSLESGAPRARFVPPATAASAKPIVKRSEDRVHHRVPSRFSPRRADHFARARAAGRDRDRASLGRDRGGAKLGDSGDSIAERRLTRRRPRRGNRRLIALFHAVAQNSSALRMTEENGCSKGSAPRCGAHRVTQRTICCERNSFCQRFMDSYGQGRAAQPATPGRTRWPRERA